MDTPLSTNFQDNSFSSQNPSCSAQYSSKPCAKLLYQKGKVKKPKRNKSAFILFSIEMRAKLKSGSPDQLNSNEMMVKLAELWKQLPKEERERYYTEAKNDKTRYLQELDNFAKNHPDESIHNKTKKNHIKKPCSSYAIFLKEMKKIIKKQKPELKMADVLKVVSERWKCLTEQEKLEYQERAKKEKELVRAKLGENFTKESKKTNESKLGLPSKKIARTQEAIKEITVKDNKDFQDQIKTEESSTSLETKIKSLGLSIQNSLAESTFPKLPTLILSDMSTNCSSENLYKSIPKVNQKQLSPPFSRNQNSNSRNEFTFQENNLNDCHSNIILNLYKQTLEKSQEAIGGLLNLKFPTERYDSLDIFDKKIIKPQPFKPTVLTPLNDLSNLITRDRQNNLSFSNILNNVILDVLQNKSQIDQDIKN